MNGLIQILGHLIDPDKIKNPKLRRVFRGRERDFLFSYGDYSDHTDKSLRHSGSSWYKDRYTDHEDHKVDRHTDYDDIGMPGDTGHYRGGNTR